MFDVNVVSADHVRHYSVVLAGAAGWEVRIEEDGAAVERRETYEDWHRVERTHRAGAAAKCRICFRSGWTIQPAQSMKR